MVRECLPLLRATTSGDKPQWFAGGDDDDEKRGEMDEGMPLLAAIFEGMPPTIFFDYPPEYGCKKRAGRFFLARGAPKMYYMHTNLVHPYNSVLNTLRRAGFKATNSAAKWSLLWSAQPKPEVLRTFNAYQKTNHFPASWHLGRKDLVWRHANRMHRKWGDECDLTPQSYILPEDLGAFNTARESNPKAVWIFKPCNASCGRGIRLLTKDSKLPKKPGVAQRYIANPLLINGHKFDLRIYIVVTSFDPLKVYMFHEGLVRLATTRYSFSHKKLGQRTMHLTNYSINKHAAAYVKNQDEVGADVSSPRNGQLGSTTFSMSPTLSMSPKASRDEGEDREEVEEDDGDRENEDGEEEGEGQQSSDGVPSKWCLADLRQYFKDNGWDFDLTLARIQDLAVKTIISVEPEIVQVLHRGTGPENLNAQLCFEVFGFDVLLDQDLKPWLLEVNVSPSLSSSSPLDRRLKTCLMADVMTLAGFRPFWQKDVEKEKQQVAEARLLGQGQKVVRPARSVTQLQETDLTEFGVEEWALIVLSYEEFMRRGNLEVIFPRPDNVDYYQKFFPTARYRNVVLQKWLARDGREVFHRMKTEGC
jgi:tubulin polyglutamylase TTLL4